ncbi:MarR family winged helix-turn-helix transcriptional regulator [Actinomadura terrae]|uniref:MarR family winged helix-turn-helix transcriptional regulator n=1 Tax=Actinomadura terrae TaxID=604353 RepID=UPI001FA7F50B|nr:MarR family transcriptional regulator [Actinomadura terrae]
MIGLDGLAPGTIPAEVMHAADHLTRVWDQARQDATPSVSDPQLHCLWAIERNAGLTLNELADLLAVRPSSATRFCDRLQATGLLERESHAVDRRKTVLSLTHHGRQLLHQIAHRRRRDLAMLVARMSTTGRTALLHGLSDLQAALQVTPVSDMPEGPYRGSVE